MKCMYQMGEWAITYMRPFTGTDYLLPPEYVDQYKDKAVSHQAPAVTEKHVGGNEEGWEDVEVGSPEEKLIVGCTKNWTVASKEDKS